MWYYNNQGEDKRESKRSGKYGANGAGRPGLSEAEGVKRQATAKGAHEATEKGKEQDRVTKG